MLLLLFAGKWYTDVVVAAELISYYDVSGCYILRPTAYSMWEVIQGFFDSSIKALGVQVWPAGCPCAALLECDVRQMLGTLRRMPTSPCSSRRMC